MGGDQFVARKRGPPFFAGGLLRVRPRLTASRACTMAAISLATSGRLRDWRDGGRDAITVSKFFVDQIEADIGRSYGVSLQ
jgi:hypothetical protein